MFAKIKEVAKAVAAGASAVAAALAGTAAAGGGLDSLGSLSLTEILVAVAAFLGAFGITYRVPNAPSA